MGSNSPVQFISDLSEPDWNVAEGRRYVPPGRPEALVTDLHAILGNRAYLVEVGGRVPINITIEGEPSRRQPTWQGQSFNFTGLHVDPAAPGTLSAFLDPSPAHVGETVMTLEASGRWVTAASNTAILPGAAYWIYASKGGDYSGPLEIQSSANEGLLYAAEITETEITLTNHMDASLVATLTNDDVLPLVRKDYQLATGAIWPPLTSHSLTLAPHETRVVTIGLRRALLVEGQTSGTVTVTGGGCRQRLPVTIQDAVLPAAAASPPAVSLRSPGFARLSAVATPPNPAHVGLWLGQVLIDEVSFVNDSEPSQRTIPVPTDREFPLRVLLHVNDAGQVRLLGQVTVLKKDTANGSEFVLVSDDALINAYDGATLVDGAPFGYRTTALGFESVGSAGTLLTGSLDTTLRGLLTIQRADPAHPYKHRYHPDHDALDPLYDPQGNDLSPILEEVWDITRSIEMTVSPQALDQNAPPDTNHDLLTGTYTESVTGMHKRPIISRGTLTLRRLTQIAEINPQP